MVDVMGALGHERFCVAGHDRGGRVAYVVGRDDFPAEARQAFFNLGRALAVAGATTDAVARLGIFAVGWCRDHLPAIEAARVALFGHHKPVDALLGVEALAHPGCLLEVGATAVIDG